jgi:hypothetical protein
LQLERFSNELVCVLRIDLARIDSHRKQTHRTRSKTVRVVAHGSIPRA